MGELKLIKGAFNGKVGEFYGAKQHRKYYVKAVPFSHTPHNEKQKQAFSAFSCLQRMSAQFSRGLWQSLGLSAKNVNKINAVCHWLKPLISNRVFDLEKMNDVIPVGTELVLRDFSFSAETQSFSIDFQNLLKPYGLQDIKICYALIGASGQGYGAEAFYSNSGIKIIPTTWQEEEDITLVFFLSYLRNNKRVLSNCSLATIKTQKGYYFDNGTFLADNFDWLQKPYFDGNVTVYPTNAAFDNKGVTVIS